jgi:hypothetical protein
MEKRHEPYYHGLRNEQTMNKDTFFTQLDDLLGRLYQRLTRVQLASGDIEQLLQNQRRPSGHVSEWQHLLVKMYRICLAFKTLKSAWKM